MALRFSEAARHGNGKGPLNWVGVVLPSTCHQLATCKVMNVVDRIGTDSTRGMRNQARYGVDMVNLRVATSHQLHVHRRRG